MNNVWASREPLSRSKLREEREETVSSCSDSRDWKPGAAGRNKEVHCTPPPVILGALFSTRVHSQTATDSQSLSHPIPLPPFSLRRQELGTRCPSFVFFFFKSPLVIRMPRVNWSPLLFLIRKHCHVDGTSALL